MTDIKELAPALAHRTCNRYKHGDEWPYQFTEQGVIDYATRLIAAYTEGQEPVAYKYISTTYPDRFYQISELTPEYFSRENWTPVPLYAAPPEPAPRPSYTGTCANLHETVQVPNAACAAPSSEKVREMANVLRVFGMESYALLIERLAARVPDGCVVVRREVTEEGKCVLATPGNYRTYQDQWNALIAAGEVKP